MDERVVAEPGALEDLLSAEHSDDRMIHFQDVRRGPGLVALCGYVGTELVASSEMAGHDRCYECLRIIAKG